VDYLGSCWREDSLSRVSHVDCSSSDAEWVVVSTGVSKYDCPDTYISIPTGFACLTSRQDV